MLGLYDLRARHEFNPFSRPQIIETTGSNDEIKAGYIFSIMVYRRGASIFKIIRRNKVIRLSLDKCDASSKQYCNYSNKYCNCFTHMFFPVFILGN